MPPRATVALLLFLWILEGLCGGFATLKIWARGSECDPSALDVSYVGTHPHPTPSPRQLHNLLVYGPGGHFAAHRDSEKVPGMFGTLVITLPCPHEGGNLVATHRGETQVFETASPAPTEIQWFAFYADVEHALQLVTSGHRVALIYNLVREGSGKIPRAPDGTLSEAAEALQGAAEAWGKAHKPELFRLTMLDHQYSEDGLDWDALKGEDAATLQALRDSECFDLQLITVKLTEHGDDGDCYGYGGYGNPEIYDRVFAFKGWECSDPENADLPDVIREHYEKTPRCTESYILEGADYFDGMDPDDEEHEGPTGNEGAPMSRWYTSAALVLRPKALRLTNLGIAALPDLLADAIDEPSALCGYPSPQALYDKFLDESDDPLAWDTEVQAGVLRRFADPEGGLSLASARDFLSKLEGEVDVCILAPEIRAVLDRFGWDDDELRRAVIDLVQTSATLTEAAAANAFTAVACICAEPNLTNTDGGVEAAAESEDAGGGGAATADMEEDVRVEAGATPQVVAVLHMGETDDAPAMTFDLYGWCSAWLGCPLA